MIHIREIPPPETQQLLFPRTTSPHWWHNGGHREEWIQQLLMLLRMHNNNSSNLTPPLDVASFFIVLSMIYPCDDTPEKALAQQQLYRVLRCGGLLMPHVFGFRRVINSDYDDNKSLYPASNNAQKIGSKDLNQHILFHFSSSYSTLSTLTLPSRYPMIFFITRITIQRLYFNIRIFPDTRLDQVQDGAE